MAPQMISATILLLAQIALAVQVILSSRAWCFMAFLVLFAMPYSVGRALGFNILDGWGIAVFALLVLAVTAESARWNWTPMTPGLTMVLGGLLLLAITVSPPSIIQFEGTDKLQANYLLLCGINGLGFIGVLMPAVTAVMADKLAAVIPRMRAVLVGRPWSPWMGWHGLILAGWFGATLAALGTWQDAMPAFCKGGRILEKQCVGGEWVVNPEYRPLMELVFGGEAIGHAACVAAWAVLFGLKQPVDHPTAPLPPA